MNLLVTAIIFPLVFGNIFASPLPVDDEQDSQINETMEDYGLAKFSMVATTEGNSSCSAADAAPAEEFPSATGCAYSLVSSFDPDRVPRTLSQVVCHKQRLRHARCEGVSYRMQVLRKGDTASVFSPVWEDVTVACVWTVPPLRKKSKQTLNVVEGMIPL